MEELLKKIIAWGESEDNIKVMILTGSQISGKGIDKFSDLDIAVFGDDFEKFTKNHVWMKEFGNVWVYESLTTKEGYPTRLIIFEGGKKVDFSFWPLYEIEKLTKSQELPPVYNRGYKVLIDKQDLTDKLPKATNVIKSTKPSEEEFISTVNEFWFEIWHVAKHLKREDLWHAKFRDWTTKELLLKMIEWYEKSNQGWDLDTYYLGVKMKNWVSKDVWEQLQECFSHFDSQDSQDKILSTAKLFSRLAKSVAEKLGYKYPQEVEKIFLN